MAENTETISQQPLATEIRSADYLLIERDDNGDNESVRIGEMVQGAEVTTATGTQTVTQALDQRGPVFDSVADMKAATGLTVGIKCRTLGYYAPGDGGGNDYEIVAAATGTDDGGSFIDLPGSGLQAKGLFPRNVYVNQFGAIPDGATNSTTFIQAALDYAQASQKRTVLSGGEYKFDQLSLPRGTRLSGIGPLGTSYDQDRFSQSVLSQNDGIELSGIILDPESGQGADLHLSDFLLLGPKTQTTGELHGIEFIDSLGNGVAVQGQAFFERMFIRFWKGSGIKTADDKGVFALFVNNVQSRDNGRYGFEIGYHADQLALRNILTEKNRLAGVYLGFQPSNFHQSIDGWYFEGGFPDQGFGTAPGFDHVSPYCIVIKGGGISNPNTSIRISNLTAKADITTNNQTIDAAIYSDPEAGNYPINIQWDNIVTETRFASGGSGLGSILLDSYHGTRIPETIVSGMWGGNTGNWAGFKNGSPSKAVYNGDNTTAIEVNRDGASGPVLDVSKDGAVVGSLGAAAEDITLLSATNSFGIRLLAPKVILPVAPNGSGLDAQVDLGTKTGRYQLAYIKESRHGAGDVSTKSGSGSPEGVVSSVVGSLYLRTDGGAGTTLYVKESGAGTNTGWVAK